MFLFLFSHILLWLLSSFKFLYPWNMDSLKKIFSVCYFSWKKYIFTEEYLKSTWNLATGNHYIHNNLLLALWPIHIPKELKSLLFEGCPVHFLDRWLTQSSRDTKSLNNYTQTLPWLWQKKKYDCWINGAVKMTCLSSNLLGNARKCLGWRFKKKSALFFKILFQF